MKSTSVSVVTAIGLALMAGCSSSGTIDTPHNSSPAPTTSAAAIDTSTPLATQLQQAIVAGDADATASLLAPGTDLEANLATGLPPLHYAIQVGNADVVSVVLEAGAPIDQRDNQGRTPLMVAACFADAATLQALLDAGAKVDDRNPQVNDWTAWNFAAGYGNVDALDVLLGVGVDIESRDMFGGTALSNAAFGGWLDATVFLLDHGADANIRDTSGSTPRGWAQFHGDQEVADIIAAAGGEL
jgi:ankyrin repeat protein